MIGLILPSCNRSQEAILYSSVGKIPEEVTLRSNQIEVRLLGMTRQESFLGPWDTTSRDLALKHACYSQGD